LFAFKKWKGEKRSPINRLRHVGTGWARVLILSRYPSHSSITTPYTATAGFKVY